MPEPTDSRSRRANGFFQRLLRLYPEEFRADYAGEMREMVAGRRRTESLPKLLWDLTVDTLRTAPREHLSIFLQDARFALRGLRKDRGFALVAIATVALGIGANSSIYSLARALLLRPLALPAAAELVTVQSLRQEDGAVDSVSHADYLDLRANAKSVRGLIAFAEGSFGVTNDTAGPPELVLGTMVSGNYFDALRVRPAFGRAFRASEDEAPGRDAVAVLGYRYWTTRFDSDPGVIGRTILINGTSFEVIGVAPEAFQSARHLVDCSVFLPLSMATVSGRTRTILQSRRERVLTVKGRLAEGYDTGSASAEFATLGARLAETHPEENRGRTYRVRTEFQNRVDQSPPDAFVVGMLLSATGLVLLIACANLANLLLARGAGRAKELAIRVAVGANRGRLLRQLLTENALIAVAGACAGLAAATGFTVLVSRLEPPAETGVMFHVDVDWNVFWFNLALAGVSAVLFGLAPSVRALRPDIQTRLRAFPAGRNTLAGVQIAMACVLLTASAMMISGIRSNLLQEPGFRRDHILIAQIEPSHLRGGVTAAREFFEKLLRDARELPGVRSAAIASATPTATSNVAFARVEPEGAQMEANTRYADAFETVIADGYFETVGVPLLRGRWMTASELRAGARDVVVNDIFAERYWPGQEAIGKRIRREGETEWYKVTGVARRTKYIFISEAPMPAVYFPDNGARAGRRTVFLHTAQDPETLAGPLRALVRKLDANVPLAGVRTMEDYHERRTVSVVQFLVSTVTGLGVLGLVLAAIGLYGVMSYSVSRRTREIGVRMAIGATRGDVLRMILARAAWIAVPGIAVGLALARLLSGVLETGLVGLAVAHPAVWISVPPLLAGVTFLSALRPALRAASTQPTEALRGE